MSDCSCSTCQGACLHKPGWFLPEEIKPLAEFLGMTEKEVFDKHLLIDYVRVVDHDVPEDFEEDMIFVLSPAIVGTGAGRVFPANPYGVCQWFQDGKCAIHPVKPYECREYSHDTPRPEAEKRHADEIPNKWVPHQKYIEDLLGYLPDVWMGDRVGAVMDAPGRTGLLTPPTAFQEDHKQPTIHIDLSGKQYEEVVEIAHSLLGDRIQVTSVGNINLQWDIASREMSVSNPTVTLAGWMLISPADKVVNHRIFVSHAPICLEVVTTPEVGMRMTKLIMSEGGLISKTDVPTPTPESIFQALSRLDNIGEIVYNRPITDNPL